DFSARSTPSTPPTPPMFSMITGWPSGACMPCARPRAKMSAGPPGGKGTIMRTGLEGYDWAAAMPGTSAAMASHSSLLTKPPLIAARSHAAVHDDLGPGNEARLVRGEKQRRVRGVAPVAREAQWNAFQAGIQECFHVA